MPRTPEFLVAESVGDAVAALQEYGDDATVVAGSTAVTIMLQQGLIEPAAIVSIGRIPGLDEMGRWAIQTRCDPIRDVRIIDRAWSSRLNPATHPDHRGLNSRLLIDATKPWEWKDRFAEPVITKDGSRATREPWAWILDPDARDPRA